MISDKQLLLLLQQAANLKTVSGMVVHPNTITSLVNEVIEAREVLRLMVNKRHHTVFIENKDHVENFFKDAEAHLAKYVGEEK